MASIALGDFPIKNYDVGRGATLQVAEFGSPEGLPVILLHGFCDLWTVWHKQLLALGGKGYHAIAPNMRGYGDSTTPESSSEYTPDHILGDILGLLDALKLEKAVFVGHDWGAVPVWMMSTAHPDRVIAVACFCVPPLGSMNMATNPIFTYQHYFQLDDRERAAKEWAYQPGRNFVLWNASAKPESQERLRRVFTADLIERGGLFVTEPEDVSTADTVISKEELQYMVTVFKRTGFKGGLAWYCQGQKIGEFVKEKGTKYPHPTLLVMAEGDYVLQPSMAEKAEELVPKLTYKLLNTSHYPQREQPEAVNEVLLDWLANVAPTNVPHKM